MENSQVDSSNDLKDVVEPTNGKDLIKIVDISKPKSGKELPLKDFLQTDEVKTLLNAKNCKSLALYFEDANDGNPPAISLVSGQIEYVGQLFVTLIRSYLEHDPAKLFILPNLLLDIILDTIELHFKEIKYPILKENLKTVYSKECQLLHKLMGDILHDIHFDHFVIRWVELFIETANEQDPETRDKILADINKLLSYSFYQARTNSPERGN